MAGGHGVETEGRLSVLETKMVGLEEKIDEIKNNHLAHLDKKVNWIIGLVVAAAVSGKIDISAIATLFK